MPRKNTEQFIIPYFNLWTSIQHMSKTRAIIKLKLVFIIFIITENNFLMPCLTCVVIAAGWWPACVQWHTTGCEKHSKWHLAHMFRPPAVSHYSLHWQCRRSSPRKIHCHKVRPPFCIDNCMFYCTTVWQEKAAEVKKLGWSSVSEYLCIHGTGANMPLLEYLLRRWS